MLAIRKTVYGFEDVFAEGGRVAAAPVRRAFGAAVFANPLAGAYHDDVSSLYDVGAEVGALLAPRVVTLLEERPPVAYGKGALVGVDGDLEHGAALIHPKLGRPFRDAVGGGKAVIPSNVKVAVPGTSIDIPIGHKDDPWSFSEIDTLTVVVPDAPRPGEVVVILVLAADARINARSGASRAT